MNATIVNTGKNTTQKNTTQTTNGLFQKYLNFCDGQMKYRYVWFLFPALILPCLFMPAAVYAIATFGGGVAGYPFLLFVFVAMLTFIGGMVATVGGQTTRVTITLFVIAVMWNIAYPLLLIALF